MKLRALAILILLILSLIPAYRLNHFLQQHIRPRESMLRLFGYLLSGLVIVFMYVFIIVYVIGLLLGRA